MKKLTILFTMLLLSASFSFAQTEISYDNDEFTDWQEYVELNQSYAVRITPAEPCTVLSIKYYVKKEGNGEGIYWARVFDWEDTEPGAVSVFEDLNTIFALSFEGWKESVLPLSTPLTYDGDFVVAYTPVEPVIFLAYDADLETGRNWTQNDVSWSEVTEHSYLIRAVVEYEASGIIEELQGSVIDIYPNPAKDVLHVDSSADIQKISLYTMAGQLVKSINVEDERTSINVAELQSGIYFLAIENASDVITKKVIVQ